MFNLEKELLNLLSIKVPRKHDPPALVPWTQIEYVVHQVFRLSEEMKAFDPNKESRVLLSVTDTLIIPLYGVGHDWIFWSYWKNEPIDFTEYLEDTNIPGLTSDKLNLLMWEGFFYSKEGKESLDGSFRYLTDAEWDILKKRKIPWNVKDWMVF